MGNFQQKHVFLKGMNLDADPRYIEEGDYGEAWNIIINNKVGGSAGTAENIKGNLSHDYTIATKLNGYVPSAYASVLTSGSTAYRYEIYTSSIVAWLDDKCIGWCGDIQNNAIYFFVCRESSNASTGAWATSKYPIHYCPRVFKYDITNDILTLLYDRISLNFDPLLPVQAKFVNNSLYFCNGVQYNSSELKHINLSISRNMLPEIDGGYEDDIDISWAKCPPKSPPVWVLQYNSGRAGQVNNLKGKTFQFASRFIYYSGEKSVWSSYSVGCPVYPKEQYPEIAPTDYNEIIIANDNYGIATNFSTYGQIISYVEYAFRETSYSQWKLIKRVPYQLNTTFINSPTASYNCIVVDGINHTNVIKFYNDEAYTVIVDEEILKPFDSIPQKAKTLESVQGRMHVADNIEDFPTLTGTSFNNTAYNLSLGQTLTVSSLDTLLTAGIAFITTQAVRNNVRVLKTNSTYSVAIQFSDRASRKTFAYTSEKLVIKTQRQVGALTLINYSTALILDGSSFPQWVKDQFTHFSILLTENNDVSFYIQCAIEHAYYVTGRDINDNPKFTKRIGQQYDLTTTPSADYKKTIEDANQYQLSQVYLDQFNYIVNRNNTADYSQGSEVWIDISNLTKYSNNVPYIYNPGDRVRLLTLGLRIPQDNATLEFDYPIKGQKGRFIVIDSETSEFNGIDSVDFGVGNTRLSVAVNSRGDIYCSRPDGSGNGYGVFNRSANLGVALNKVAIQKINGDCKIVVVGNNGEMYTSSYSTIGAGTWTKVLSGLVGVSKNILNITYWDNNVGTSGLFFFCGSDGLLGVIDTIANTVQIQVLNGTNPDATTYDLSGCELRGIDCMWDIDFPGPIIYVIIACFANKDGIGICIVAEVMKTGLFSVPSYIKIGLPVTGGVVEPPNYNDCVGFKNPQLTNNISITLGGKGENSTQGQVNHFSYITSTHSLSFDAAISLGDSRFGEVTSMCKFRKNSTEGIIYLTTVDGSILARYWQYLEVGGAQFFISGNPESKTQKRDIGLITYVDPKIYGFIQNNSGYSRFLALSSCITNTNIITSDTITPVCKDIDPFPFSPISIIQGNSKLNDITIASQNTGIQYTDGTIRAVGSFFCNGIQFDYGYVGSSKTATRIDAFISDTTKPVLNYGALIEIYRPKAKKSQIYYESILGSSFYDSTNKYYQTSKKRIYSILTPLNDTIGQYGITSTTLSGDEGDCFCLKKNYKGRLWNKAYDIISMTPDASNITGNHINSQDVNTPFGWQKTNGKPNLKAVFTEAISFKKTGHRFSNQYLPNSKINGLSSFESGNEKIFPQEYIEINKLIVASDNKINGSILLSLFTENSVSIYINRSQITDGSGDRQVGLSDQVLGSFNTLDGGYGCVHPESVSTFNQKVWWWDANKGVQVRYSRNGVTPSSDIYKVRSYVRPKAKSMAIQYSNPAYNQLAPGTYDFYNDLYLLCFREVISGLYKGETLVFDEELDSFISKYDISDSSGITPEMMANVYNHTFSFLKGIIHIHNTGEYNTFFGHKKDSTIEIITNKFPSDVKEFANISLESADKWSISKQITSIYNKKIKQLSGLDLTDYATQEGIYKADLRKDINTVDRFAIKTGTITASTTSTTITGVGTLFTTELKVGYAIFSSNTYIGTVKTAPTSNTSLELEEKATINVSALAYMGAPIPVGYTESDSINVGDKLRGNYMITKLKLDASITTKSQIFAVNIEFNASEPLISK